MRAPSIIANVVLGAIGLWYWDAYLLKKHMDEPALMFVALAVIFGAVCLLRASARHTAPAERGRLTRIWARLDRGDLVLIALFLVLAGVQHHSYMRAASDGRAYFLMVRSLVMDWDVSFTEDVARFGYGGGVLNYALGTPLSWIPFYLAGHAWLALCNLAGADYPVEGFFNPYQRAVGLGTLVYGMAALVVLRSLLRRHFSEGLALFTPIAVAVGGWLAWYMTVDASWSHALSALTCALFVDYWDRTREGRTRRQWIVFGLLGGAIILVRWQNLFFAVFPAYDALREYARTADRRPTLATHGMALGAAFLTFFPQILVWRLGREGWLDVPVGEHPIFWDSRYFWDSLFHLDRGVFTWTPLMALAVAGVFLFLGRDRTFAGLLLAAFALQVWINGTLWWGEHGFGARRFSQSVVIFTVGLAALLDWLRRRPMLAPASLVVGLIVFNLFFMRAVHTSALQQQGNVSFGEMVSAMTDVTGHPLSLPVNAWYAWRYRADWGLYGRIGAQTFNNARIDVGAPGDEQFLGGGWSHRERADGDTFRWAVGREAFVLVQTKQRAPYAMVFEAAPFLYDDAPTQSVEIEIDGEVVGAVDLAKDVREYRIDLPEERMRSGLNVFRLRFATAVSPASRAMSEDPRPLAVRFHRIELLRLR